MACHIAIKRNPLFFQQLIYKNCKEGNVCKTDRAYNKRWLDSNDVG